MSASHKSEKTEKSTHKTHKKDSQLKTIVLIAILVLVGLVVVLRATSDSSDKKATTNPASSYSNPNGKAKLFLKPVNQNISVGSSVTFEVWVDTGNQPVNAVQANLTYPTDKFDYTSIDAKGSAFEVQAMSTGGDGKINIARGHIGNVKGSVLVAKVTLTAKTDKGDAPVEFAAGSAVVRSTDHIDILQTKTGSTYKISKIPGRVALIHINKV